MTMDRSKLARLLRETADAVESGDSAEGCVQWLLDDGEALGVEASIRVSGIDGQGGVILIGEADAETVLPTAVFDRERVMDAVREAAMAELFAGTTPSDIVPLARLIASRVVTCLTGGVP